MHLTTVFQEHFVRVELALFRLETAPESEKRQAMDELLKAMKERDEALEALCI